jgi:hypothetical protein
MSRPTKRPEGFSLDRADDYGTTAGVTDGQAKKVPFPFRSFFFLFLAGNALQKSDDFGCSSRGSTGADFDGFGETSALAPHPPCAFAGGNEGENLVANAKKYFQTVPAS